MVNQALASACLRNDIFCSLLQVQVSQIQGCRLTLPEPLTSQAVYLSGDASLGPVNIDLENKSGKWRYDEERIPAD